MPVAVPLERFGLINDAVDPAVRVFSNAPHEESEFSQTIPQRDISPKQEFYFTGYQSELSLASADVEGIPQAETWMTGYTPVKLVGIGAGYFIQWYDASRLRIREAMPIDEARITRGEYMMSRDGGDREGHGVYLSRNGLTHLAPANGGWVDTNNNDLPDGYEDQGTFNSQDFTNGVYEGTADGSTTAFLRAKFPFPVEGVSLTLSVDIIQLHPDGNTEIGLVRLDESQNLISQDFKIATSTGRIKLDITTEPNTHFLRVTPIRAGGVTSTGSVKIKDPCLRVDGSDQYVPK